MALAAWAGNGGSIIKGSDTLFVGGWTAKKTSMLGETTNSATAHWETSVATKKSVDIHAETIWDGTASKQPEGLGLDVGDSATVTLNIGDSALKYTSVPVIVTGVEITGCTQEGAVKANLDMRVNGTMPDPA